MTKFITLHIAVFLSFLNSFGVVYHHLMVETDGINAAENIVECVGSAYNSSIENMHPVPAVLVAPNSLLAVREIEGRELFLDRVLLGKKTYTIVEATPISNSLLAIYKLNENVEDIQPAIYNSCRNEDEYELNENNHFIPERPVFYIVSFGNLMKEHSREILPNTKKHLGTNYVLEKDDSHLYTKFTEPHLNARRDWLVPPTILHCKLLKSDVGAIMLKSEQEHLRVVGIAEEIDDNDVLDESLPLYNGIDSFRRISMLSNKIDSVIGLSRCEQIRHYLSRNNNNQKRVLNHLELLLQIEWNHEFRLEQLKMLREEKISSREHIEANQIGYLIEYERERLREKHLNTASYISQKREVLHEIFTDTEVAHLITFARGDSAYSSHYFISLCKYTMENIVSAQLEEREDEVTVSVDIETVEDDNGEVSVVVRFDVE